MVAEPVGFGQRHGMMGDPLGVPPGPVSWPLVGVLPQFRRDPTGFLQTTARKYGDISYFRLGLQRIYFLNRPDLIEEVLVSNQGNFRKSRMLQRARTFLGDGLLTAEGKLHLQQRRLAQPAFALERMRGYAEAMVECAAAARERWEEGETVNVDAEMARLALAIAGRTLFAVDIENGARDIGQALTDVIKTFDVMLTPGASVLRHLPIPAMRRARRGQRYLDSVIAQIIAERRASGRDHGDLMSMLLAAEDQGSRMTDKQVRDHALTFLLAGHETTAVALTWAWHLLGANPHAAERMRTEISDVVGERLPDYSDLEKLEYTRRVLLETLRLYPPVWALGRMSIHPARLYNYTLPSRSICVLSPYVTHRHPRLWPDPDRFDPDRFTPEATAERARFAYFPFGGGTRTCIGERFAMTEGVLLLATIAQRWNFRPVPGERVEIHPLITLRPRFGLKMVCERACQANARCHH